MTRPATTRRNVRKILDTTSAQEVTKGSEHANDSRPHPDRVIAELWKRRDDGTVPEVYAILDGARDERIVPAIQASKLESVCLYRGELHPELAAVAPYLVHLQPDDPFTKWLLVHGWGESWGIFVLSAASLRILRRHFRTFLMVYDEDNQQLYFRFYDPRVARVFLPTCDEDEIEKVFGPVDWYFAESECKSIAVKLTRLGKKPLRLEK